MGPSIALQSGMPVLPVTINSPIVSPTPGCQVLEYSGLAAFLVSHRGVLVFNAEAVSIGTDPS